MTATSSSGLRELSEALPSIYEKSELVSALSEQTDTEIAVHGYSYIDAALHFALVAAGASKIPSNLFSKIDLAYSLGMISERFKADLHSVRIIRNLFAHSVMNYSFNTKQVEEICFRFEVPQDFENEGSSLVESLAQTSSKVPSFYPAELILTCLDDAGAVRIMARVPEPPTKRPATARECFVEMVQVAWFLLIRFGASEYPGVEGVKSEPLRRSRDPFA